MIVYLAADHRGFVLKEELKLWLIDSGVAGEDLGADSPDPADDYPMFARRVAEAVLREQKNGEEARGIVICGSGVGVDIVANRYHGIRCGLGFTKPQVVAARRDDDINVLALAADFIDLTQAKVLIKAFLETTFSQDERYIRRIADMK